MLLRLDHPLKALICVVLFCSVTLAQDTETEAKPEKAKATAKQNETSQQKDAAKRKDDAKKRAASLRKLADRLEIRPGATIADIGAGKGDDSWVFADIVGEQGRVFSVEISAEDVMKLKDAAVSRKLTQVRPVLGYSNTPNLPDNSVDLAFMHYVYHHLAKPREMLRSIWQSLKPGGYYVVVDRHQGTLVDWVAREDREKKHFWLAETTFMREAREEGFEFVDFGEQEWFAKNDTFVFIMQRPTQMEQSGHDPDPLPPIDLTSLNGVLDENPRADSRIAFIALGEGRKLIKPILQRSNREALDIVLEEWATQKDERPKLPQGVKLKSVLTEKGDPTLSADPLNTVFFLDTYHLLFHGDVLLPALREKLTDEGRVYILDRQADETISHREASHRRMIASETVEQEMSGYGFDLESSSSLSSGRRFLQVYRKHR